MTDLVFISYSRRDGGHYAALAETKVRKAGFQVWRDELSLNPFRDFSVEIELAIRAARVVLVCVTPALDASESFVRREIIYAQEHHKPILPILLDSATAPILINNLPAIEVRDFELDFPAVLARLRTVAPSGPSNADPCATYLRAFLDQIVEYLETSTLSLVSVQVRTEPGLVETRDLGVPVKIVSAPLPMRSRARAEIEPQVFADMGDAFERYGGSLLLLGEPGAGKSTMLWAFARELVLRRLADPTQPLPLLAQIPTWDADAAPDLQGWLKASIRQLEPEVLGEALRSGNVVLLLDALDELGRRRRDSVTGEDFDPRARFVPILRADLKQIVTCRLTDYREIGRKIPLNGAVVLQPLDHAQIAKYLEAEPGVWELLKSDSALLEASRTPLVLSLLVFALTGDGQIREFRGIGDGELRDRLFDSYLRRRYRHEALKPFADLTFTEEETRQALSWLSFEALAAVRSALDPLAVMLSGARARVALNPRLRPRSEYRKIFRRSKGVHSFLEFAKRLHLLLPNPDGSARFIHVLLRDSLGFQHALTMMDHRDVALGFQAVAAIRQVADRRAALRLVEAMRHDPRLDIRAIAAHAATAVAGVEVFDDLVALFSDGSEELRSIAVREVSRLPNPVALEGLLIALRLPETSHLASQRLHWRRGRGVVAGIVKVLREESHPKVRVNALLALRQIDTPASRAALKRFTGT